MAFKTDSLNTKSWQARVRLGATEEGTFHNHMVMPSGHIRHKDALEQYIPAHCEQQADAHPDCLALKAPSPIAKHYVFAQKNV